MMPEHGTPEALRWAADEIKHVAEVSDDAWSARDLRQEADRRDAEQGGGS